MEMLKLTIFVEGSDHKQLKLGAAAAFERVKQSSSAEDVRLSTSYVVKDDNRNYTYRIECTGSLLEKAARLREEADRLEARAKAGN